VPESSTISGAFDSATSHFDHQVMLAIEHVIKLSRERLQTK